MTNFDDFIDAYRTDTGEKVRIPKTHLDVFPGAFSKTPRQKAADRAVTAKPITDSAPAGTKGKD